MSTKQRIAAYGIVVALAATLVTFTAASSLSQHSAGDNSLVEEPRLQSRQEPLSPLRTDFHQSQLM